MGLSSVRKIPSIMTNLGWVKAAFLLETWFTRAKYTRANGGATPVEISSAVYLNNLDWVIGTTEGKTTFENIFAKSFSTGRGSYTSPLWRTNNAKLRLAELLKADGILTPGAKNVSFGYRNNYGAQDFERDTKYLSYSSFQTGIGTQLTHTVATLGSFVLKFALNGKVTHAPTAATSVQSGRGMINTAAKPNRYLVTPESVDVYLWDLFDFEDDGLFSQPLGCWNEDDNSVSPTEVPVFGKKVCVNNASFRQWRDANNAGGDFYVYTNVGRFPITNLDQKKEFEIFKT
jgi:hypothetical protein